MIASREIDAPGTYKPRVLAHCGFGGPTTHRGKLPALRHIELSEESEVAMPAVTHRFPGFPAGRGLDSRDARYREIPSTCRDVFPKEQTSCI